MVWPVVVGVPVPTVPSRIVVPEPVVMYSCPPKMFVCRRLVPVVLTIVVVVPPSVANKTPLLDPVAHKSVPLVDVAERMCPVLNAFSAVELSMVALKSTRPMTRLTVAEEVPETAAVPVGVPYPVRIRNRPSADRVMSPSDEAVPLDVNWLFAPLTVVGIATD